jgi:hypothetical protein
MGWDELRLPNAVRPGDELDLEITVLEKRESKSKSDRGIVRNRILLRNQRRETVLQCISNILVRGDRTRTHRPALKRLTVHDNRHAIPQFSSSRLSGQSVHVAYGSKSAVSPPRRNVGCAPGSGSARRIDARRKGPTATRDAKLPLDVGTPGNYFPNAEPRIRSR